MVRIDKELEVIAATIAALDGMKATPTRLARKLRLQERTKELTLARRNVRGGLSRVRQRRDPARNVQIGAAYPDAKGRKGAVLALAKLHGMSTEQVRRIARDEEERAKREKRKERSQTISRPDPEGPIPEPDATTLQRSPEKGAPETFTRKGRSAVGSGELFPDSDLGKKPNTK